MYTQAVYQQSDKKCIYKGLNQSYVLDVCMYETKLWFDKISAGLLCGTWRVLFFWHIFYSPCFQEQVYHSQNTSSLHQTLCNWPTTAQMCSTLTFTIVTETTRVLPKQADACMLKGSTGLRSKSLIWLRGRAWQRKGGIVPSSCTSTLFPQS